MRASNKHEKHIITLAIRMFKREKINEEDLIEDFEYVSKQIARRWFYAGMVLMGLIQLITEWIIKPML